METKTISKPENKVKRPHALHLEQRQKVTLSGVEEVISMAETAAQIITSAGGLRIDGAGMHIAKYSADEGLLIIDGTINRLQYTADAGKGFFKRMFK